MWNFFKSKTEKLEIKRKQLLEQAHRWSSIDRKKSDQYYAMANQILDQMEG